MIVTIPLPSHQFPSGYPDKYDRQSLQNALDKYFSSASGIIIEISTNEVTIIVPKEVGHLVVTEE